MKDKVGLTLEGKPQIVSVIGEAGLGKTRLVDELRSYLFGSHRDRALWLEGRALSHGQTLSYWLFLEILKTIYGIREQDKEQDISQKVIDRTKKIFPERYNQIAPYILTLFSIPVTGELEEKVKYLDPQNLQIQIFVSVRDLLVELAKRKPLVIFFEDLHWADPTSIELLQFLMNTFYGPVMLVFAFRPEKESGAWKIKELAVKQHKEKYAEVALERLSDTDSARLVDNLLKISGLTEQGKGLILSKAEGNPFYLEEILRSMIDNGVLVFESNIPGLASQSGAGWHLTSDISTLEIPDTIQGVIASRIDRLEDDVKRVLQMAAVIGKSFFKTILEYVTEAEKRLDEHLGKLEERELVLKLTTELEYAFKHPLTQEVAYNSLLKKKRKEFHLKVAQAIESIYKDKLEEFTELLAHNYSNSDNLEKAVEWLTKAGEKAREKYANQQAFQYYCEALQTLEKIPCAEKDLPQKLKKQLEVLEKKDDIIRFELGGYEKHITTAKEFASLSELASSIGDKEMEYKAIVLAAENYSGLIGYKNEVINYRNKSYELAKTIGKKELIADRLSHLGGIYAVEGDFKTAKTYLAQALKLVEECEDSNEKADTIRGTGSIYLCIIEDYMRAKSLFEKAMIIAVKLKDEEFEAECLRRIGETELALGNFDESLIIIQRGLILAERMRHLRLIESCHYSLRNFYEAIGNVDEVLKHAKICLDLLDQIGRLSTKPMVLQYTGLVYIWKGEYLIAIEHLKDAIKVTEEIGGKGPKMEAMYLIGDIYREIGYYEAAIKCHQDLLGYVKSSQYDEGVSWATGAIGLDYLCLNRIADAFTLLNDVIKTFPKNEYPQEMATYLFGLGQYYKTINKPEEAINYYCKSILLVEKQQDKIAKGIYNVQLAKVYFETSKVEVAQKILNESVFFAYISQCPELHYQACHLQGKIFEKQGKTQEALGQYRKAKEIIETVGNKITDEHLRECYLAVKERKEVYEDCERLETGDN
ncbi:AAA family ATPase [candidate division TA06 bacterium]|uniref:AAA family ATPase n=1 Tax=candidate division TA06 bacterium TaxID=2250710 RepID=A0A933IBG6_UNCT6|nr:AAA family ATPase [candidate division TA06 bacterium]